MSTIKQQKAELAEFYEDNLFEFAKYINPQYMYGDIHKEVFDAMQENDEYQLFLLPRDHLKSHCLAVYAAWQIVREPWCTIVYLTAGDDLATVQMYSIKKMLTSEELRLLWPDIVNKREGDRDKWSAFAINVDHPSRTARGIRDYTLVIKTIKSSATGLHCSLLLMDDIVVPKNAYTASGRAEVAACVADFSSIKSTTSKTKAVGTIYDERDVWNSFIEAEVPIWDRENKVFDGVKPLWRIFKREVENSEQGIGEFLWPRIQSPHTGEGFGFDPEVLAKKRIEYQSQGYSDRFYSQYYNNPNMGGAVRVDALLFQYYNPAYLTKDGFNWTYNGKRLSLFAGMDCAWTDKLDKNAKRADFTAIIVIGLDEDGFIYVLDMKKFQTDKYDKYYSEIVNLQLKWGFRFLKIETNSAGKLIKKEIDTRIRKNGQSLATEARVQTKADGAKEERIAAILEPKYKMGVIFHKKGGLTAELETEVVSAKPPHDDLKDAFAIALENAKMPGRRKSKSGRSLSSLTTPSSRFGGGRRAR